MSYKTFKRSAANFQQFAAARKITDETGLTYEEARAKCEMWNAARTRSLRGIYILLIMGKNGAAGNAILQISGGDTIP